MSSQTQPAILSSFNHGTSALVVFEGQAYKIECVSGVFRKSQARGARAYLRSCLALRPDSQFHMVPMDLQLATSWLRWIVFTRQEYKCAKCGRQTTWDSGELHEKITRGQGGYRTVTNCELLCIECHTGSRGEHGFARAQADPEDVLREVAEVCQNQGPDRC